MVIFSEDMEIARSISARIASYSSLLLEARKSNRIACSILSLVGALSCKPTPVPICQEAPSTLRIHQFPGPRPIGGSQLKSLPIFVNLLLSEVFTRYQTRLAQ